MRNPAIEQPPAVMLKHIKLHMDDSSVTISQRRTYHNEVWGLESTASFFQRAQHEIATLESQGIEVKRITSSSSKSNLKEDVLLDLPDLMNRFRVLDYLSAMLFPGAVLKIENQDDITFAQISPEVRDAAQEAGVTGIFAETKWGPSTDVEHAVLVQVTQSLSVQLRTSRVWEASYNDAHKHFCPGSYLTLEILRTAIRKNYHDKPAMLPTSAFLALGASVINPGQRGHSTEVF